MKTGTEARDPIQGAGYRIQNIKPNEAIQAYDDDASTSGEGYAMPESAVTAYARPSGAVRRNVRLKDIRMDALRMKLGGLLKK